MEDWALIRRLVADGVPQRQVARDLGVGRSTVERALASDRPPRYERPVVTTSFTRFEPLVRQVLKATPDMPATVIAERVGWTGSITWFRDNVRRLRPEHRPVDPSDRLIWLPGDAAQCDLWFPPKKIALEDGGTTLLPVMVITAAHSRFVVGRMIPTRHTQDLLLGMWELLQQLGRVPRRLIWDNESGIGRGKRHAEGVGAFTGANGRHPTPDEGRKRQQGAAAGHRVVNPGADRRPEHQQLMHSGARILCRPRRTYVDVRHDSKAIFFSARADRRWRGLDSGRGRSKSCAVQQKPVNH